MILSSESITDLNIIHPCEPKTEYLGITYGLGLIGYDVQCEFDSAGDLEYLVMLPGEFKLASTIERFTMPNYVIGIIHDKSSWARRGLAVQNTVIEPGWVGHLTLELTNHGTDMLNIRRGVGIAQVVFHEVDRRTSGYSGKYQNQERGPQEAR